MTENYFRILCRIKPESIEESPFSVNYDTNSIKYKDKDFSYNRVLLSSQREFYEEAVRDSLRDFLKGYNVTQMAYGQTGSGKTWTMMGDETELNRSLVESKLLLDSNIGVTPRIIQDIFHYIDLEENEDVTFEIEVSYLEIYLERINDLLSGKDNLSLRDSSTGVFVQGLEKVSVTSMVEVLDLIRSGNLNRKTASTKMNDRSSRSHSVFTIYLNQYIPSLGEGEGDSVREGSVIKSVLNIVDLAGSEKTSQTKATGEVLKQGSSINLSLTILGAVITELSKESSSERVTRYRESKLTHLLQQSLIGNSKTIVSLNVALKNVTETLSTFEFGMRAGLVKTQTSRVIHKSREALEKEVLRLKTRLSEVLSHDESTGECSSVYSIPDQESLKSEIILLRRENEVLRKKIEELKSETKSLASVSNQGETYKGRKVIHVVRRKRRVA